MADDHKPDSRNVIPYIEARADTGERCVTDHGYSTDFGQWAADQARALREAARAASNLPIDWENVAEEIEALGKSQDRELGSRITTILVHLIKLEVSPTALPRWGWRETIQEQRDEIADLLEDTPSLRGKVPSLIEEKLPKARMRAALALAEYGEQPRTDVARVAYTADQVCGVWFPAD